ncbi:hypothetical protein AX14_005140 [Amanita brunnescens Koide BX004]|nr:hypothetical protein AX14_005140 [Amanita brunnescens Koide BX004]
MFAPVQPHPRLHKYCSDTPLNLRAGLHCPRPFLIHYYTPTHNMLFPPATLKLCALFVLFKLFVFPIVQAAGSEGGFGYHYRAGPSVKEHNRWILITTKCKTFCSTKFNIEQQSSVEWMADFKECRSQYFKIPESGNIDVAATKENTRMDHQSEFDKMRTECQEKCMEEKRYHPALDVRQWVLHCYLQALSSAVPQAARGKQAAPATAGNGGSTSMEHQPVLKLPHKTLSSAHPQLGPNEDYEKACQEQCKEEGKTDPGLDIGYCVDECCDQARQSLAGHQAAGRH